MHIHNTQYWQLGLSASAVFLLCMFMVTTNPRNLTAVLLLVPPLLLFATVFGICRFVLSYSQRLDAGRARFYSLLLALGPVIITTLGSIGQLTVRDVLLSAVLLFGIAWYAARYRSLSA